MSTTIRLSALQVSPESLDTPLDHYLESVRLNKLYSRVAPWIIEHKPDLERPFSMGEFTFSDDADAYAFMTTFADCGPEIVES